MSINQLAHPQTKCSYERRSAQIIQDSPLASGHGRKCSMLRDVYRTDVILFPIRSDMATKLFSYHFHIQT